MPDYVCVGGHDKCREITPGPECPYCEPACYSVSRDPLLTQLAKNMGLSPEQLIKDYTEADYSTRDPIVEAVRTDLLQRSEVGIKKYGVTLARTDLKMRDWLQHAYKETLDQANYLKRAIMEMDRQENWLGEQIRGWVEGLQPTDLRNRTIGELQDEIHRRQTEAE